MMGMPAASMSPGMAEAQARISAIRDRIEGLTAAATPFQLATSGPGPTPGTPGPGTSASGLVDAATAASGLEPAPAMSNPPAPTASVAAPVASSGPGGGTGQVRRGDALAAVLPEHGRAWAPAIERAALQAGIEPALLASVVRHESNFRPGVVSHAGAIGLAQLMPGTAAGLGVDPNDPQQNLEGGARYLRQQLDRFGSVDLALAAYNAGPNRVAQAGGVPRITETTTYVQRVSATWEQWR